MPERDASTNRMPFLASFVPQWNAEEIQEAIEETAEAYLNYDPITQTSIVPLEAGTARTYRNTYSGLWAKKDDDEADDT